MRTLSARAWPWSRRAQVGMSLCDLAPLKPLPCKGPCREHAAGGDAAAVPAAAQRECREEA